ncbi:putative DNA-directed RNA polymerase II [Aureobasidium pullulans]|nr:putative DNA-directed RNA polymerase II [Aureobasidium pullulans]
MFFLHEMERVVNLHPSYFDKDTHKYITDTLYQDVEGTNTGNFYIVCVVSVLDISEPRVLPGSGFAEFTIMFKAVVWRPFKGEVCDGMVSSVVSNGFFVDVGPLNIFVSKAMIPSDIKFDGNATPPQFTDNADQVIERGTHIRVKIKGIRGEVGQMYAIATIKEDYLGPLLET